MKTCEKHQAFEVIKLIEEDAQRWTINAHKLYVIKSNHHMCSRSWQLMLTNAYFWQVMRKNSLRLAMH